MPVSVILRVGLAVLGVFCLTTALPHILPQRGPKGTVELPSEGTPARGNRVPTCNYGGQPYYFVATDEAAPFNATPKSYDMRAYDPRCQPRPLVEQLLHANATGERHLRIMLYGDRCGPPSGVRTWHLPRHPPAPAQPCVICSCRTCTA